MVDHKNIIVSKRLVAINSASSVAAKLINMTALLWMYQYLLRRIPAEEFAVLPVVTAVMVLAPLFFSLFTGGISRYVIEAYARGEFEQVSRVVSSIFPPLAVMAAVFMTVGGIFAFNIEKVLNIAPQMVSDARIMMALLVATFSLQMLALPFGTGFNVRQRFVELNFLEIGRDIIRILLLLMLLFGIGPQVLWVVVATAISETVYIGIKVFRSCRMVPELLFRPALFSWGQAQELMNFGFWTTIGSLGGVMYTNAATILLNLFGTPVEVTSYYIGSTFYRQLDATIALASEPLRPAITAMHALKDNQRLGRTVFRGGRYATWVAMAVATPLAIYASNFIELYLGDGYPMAALVIIGFMAIFPFTKPTALLGITAMATGRVKAFFLPAFMFQLAGLGLMMLFTVHMHMGVLGVVIPLAAITIASQLFYYWSLCIKLTGMRHHDFLKLVLYPGFTPAVIGAAAWITLKMYFQPDSWASLILCAGLGLLVYITVLIGLCLDNHERAEVNNAAARIFKNRHTNN